MTAGDVTITRGIGDRDDQLTVTQWSQILGTGWSAGTLTTDGDIATATATATSISATTMDLRQVPNPVGGSITTAAYTRVLIRHKDNFGSSGLGAQLQITYTDSFADAFVLTNSATWITETFNLTSGHTLSNGGASLVDQFWYHQSGGAVSGTFTENIDFIFICKEVLTLPAASQPLQLPLLRRVADLQIPSREGSVLQDLGSPSPQIEVGGTLITTSSPNNYTGDQWWDVLVGVWLEANWQWFASDRVAYKYQITELSNTQNPGRVGYYDFKLKLKKIDILTATAQTFSSNIGTGAIQ